MRTKRLLVILVCAALIFATGCWGNNPATTTKVREATVKVRIGWQVPWSTQGQLVQVLKHTEILKNNGIEAEFIGKTYGPELNEAALAGGIDVVLTADQPAATLFSKDKGWIGIGKLMYNRTSTYVPPNSKINTIRDLKGKTIGIPFGAAAQRVTVEALKREGLDPQKDVKILNVGIMEQMPIIEKGKITGNWGNIDALSGFDPTPAVFEAKGLVKVLDVGKVCSLVLMNKDFMQKNSGVAQRYMQAMVDAYDYYRNNVTQANIWFAEEAGLKDVDDKACGIASSVEPNVTAKTKDEIRVWFTDEDFAIMQKGADFIASNLKKNINMKDYVTNEYVGFNQK